MLLNGTDPFIDLVFAPQITVTNVQSLLVIPSTGEASIVLSSKTCERNVIVLVKKFTCVPNMSDVQVSIPSPIQQ